MPIYEYQCQECEHQFDVLQKMSDDRLKDCPECQEPALIKLVSAPSFRLSGSGWYETDFKTGNDKKKNLVDSGKGNEKSGTAAASDAGNTTEGKAESKVESKTESKTESKSTKADKPKKTEKSSSSTSKATA